MRARSKRAVHEQERRGEGGARRRGVAAVPCAKLAILKHVYRVRVLLARPASACWLGADLATLECLALRAGGTA